MNDKLELVFVSFLKLVCKYLIFILVYNYRNINGGWILIWIGLNFLCLFFSSLTFDGASFYCVLSLRLPAYQEEVCMSEIGMTACTKCKFPLLLISSVRYSKEAQTFQTKIERKSCAHNIFNVVDDKIACLRFKQLVHLYHYTKDSQFCRFRFLSIDFGWSLGAF